MNQRQQVNKRRDGTEAPQNSEFSSGFVAGYRQALNAMRRATAASVQPETVLKALEGHLLNELIDWRNTAVEGTPPPKLPLWK